MRKYSDSRNFCKRKYHYVKYSATLFMVMKLNLIIKSMYARNDKFIIAIKFVCSANFESVTKLYIDKNISD